MVYVAGLGSGNVSGYSINPMTGALTVLATSPFAAGTGGLNGITFDPSGKYVYVAGFGGIFSFSIDLNPDAFAFEGGLPVQLFGQLTLIGGSPFGGGNPASIVVDYTGAFAYATDKSSNEVVAFALSGGKLTANSETPMVSAGSLPVSIALVRPESVPGYTASRIPQTTSAGFPTQSMIASAINNKGDVAGSVVYYPQGVENFAYGFLYSGGVTISVGEFSGNHLSEAYALNDNDQVVGQMTLSPPIPNAHPPQAFLYSNGTTTDLDTSVNGGQEAVIDKDGATLDLNRLVDPSLTYLTGAADINNRGQIVVSGLDGNLYVLTPRK